MARPGNSPGVQITMQYIGIDGVPTYMKPEDMRFPRLLCLACCPCFVPPLCSGEKQRQYRNMVKSFTFVISIIQVIVFIVELALGGK